MVLKCQAGCDTRDIIARVGIKPRDLFYDAEAKPTERPQIVSVYEYPNGVQKLRKSDKSFTWRRPDGKGGWIYNRQGVPHSLYVAGSLGTVPQSLTHLSHPFPYRLQPYRLEESRPPLRAGRHLYMKVPNHLQTFSAPN